MKQTPAMVSTVSTISSINFSAMQFVTRCVAMFAVWGFVAMPVKAERLPIGQPPAFWIDRTEVTIGQFEVFATQNALQTKAERTGTGYEYRFGWQPREDWNFRTPYGGPATAQEPAVHVNWFEAEQYCQAQGGRLPNRQQWIKAAYQETRTEPTKPFELGQTYPYPTGVAAQNANVKGDQDGWPQHAPVASFVAGVNGLYDIGANAWEWLADAQGNDRLTAGGSWWYGPNKMQASGLQYKPADFYAVYVGYRCVYDAAR